MPKQETNIPNLKINYGTYQNIQTNLSQIGENELIITSDKNIPIPTANDTGKIPKVNNSGEYELAEYQPGSVLPAVTSNDNGKILGVVNGDWNKTTLPTASSSAAGIVKLGSDTVQSVAANNPSSTANRTYPVQVNSASQAVVNVPLSEVTANTQLSGNESELTSLTINGVTYKVASTQDFYQAVSTAQYGTPIVNP